MSSPDPFAEPLPATFVVGIDLGTTNSAVCYVDTRDSKWQAQVLDIPQLVAPSQVEARDTLPSFHYQPTSAELQPQALQLPWSAKADKQTSANYAVGFYARDYGGSAPGRLIASAKSWLCHPGVDRTADLLPWNAAEDVEKISPVEASSRYLAHIRAAWNAVHPQHPLEEQDIVLTLPASFDEVARELTIAAAAKAGLPKVMLIEEPQAAFYAWINKHRDNWDQLVTPGQKILVCDVGGGTTDFTLIRVRQQPSENGASGLVQFHRVAVGEHLLLGGDNFDLALAQYLEHKITGGKKLSPRQWDVLLRVGRKAKEELLGDTPPPAVTLTLPGSGSRLIGDSLSVELTKEEVDRLLVDGFFPTTELADRPANRRSGFQEFGLPFAADAAITKHLSSFLQTHRFAGEEATTWDESTPSPDPARPDVLLLNGGVFCSPALRQRVVQTIAKWFASKGQPNWQPQLLENDRLDLAVARGAAYYGMVRRGQGVRISASLARTYYLELDSHQQAVCLVPGNAEPGTTLPAMPQTFELVLSQPVEFRLLVSSTRLTDTIGQVVSIDPEQMRPLPPIRTAIRTARRSEQTVATVQLVAHLTEIGTLHLECVETTGDRRWQLQFDVRSATQTDRPEQDTHGESLGVLDESVAQACEALIAATFSDNGTASPDALYKSLTEAIGLDKSDWPPTLLRRLWESLLQHESGRRKSAAHEARWLNLVGYSLRPGYGLPVDDFRVAETWKKVQGKVIHPAATCRTEALILFRRIAGGFSAGQQRALAEPLVSTVRALHKRATAGNTPAPGGKGTATKAVEANLSPHESLELFRLLGSLELLPVTLKRELGQLLLVLSSKRRYESQRLALFWTLGRLGSRTPIYGPLNTTLPASDAESWTKEIVTWATAAPPETLQGILAPLQLAVVQLSRRTDDRYRDISESLRNDVDRWLTNTRAPAHQIELVTKGGLLEQEEQAKILGDSLPKGLRLRG